MADKVVSLFVVIILMALALSVVMLVLDTLSGAGFIGLGAVAVLAAAIWLLK